MLDMIQNIWTLKLWLYSLYACTHGSEIEKHPVFRENILKSIRKERSVIFCLFWCNWRIIFYYLTGCYLYCLLLPAIWGIVLRRKSFIRPHKAAAGRRLAPALHSKAGHRICSWSHEECVLTWLACFDRPQDYSFLVTMGANGVLGLFIDIKALTSNAHFKLDWPTRGINNNWLLHWFQVLEIDSTTCCVF